MSVTRSTLVAAGLLTFASVLSAQTEGTLGLNFRVVNTTEIGVTWQTSPGLALRPSVSYNWFKVATGLGGTIETAQYGADLDVLVGLGGGAGRVKPYLGMGGGVLYVDPTSAPAANALLARAFFGARIKIVDRVAVFGEIGIEYRDGDAPLGDAFSTGTAPIGIVVFLK